MLESMFVVSFFSRRDLYASHKDKVCKMEGDLSNSILFICARKDGADGLKIKFLLYISKYLTSECQVVGRQ